MTTDKPKNYLEILSEQSAELSTRLKLNNDQAEELKNFVVDTNIRAWRLGRSNGFAKAKECDCEVSHRIAVKE